MSPEQEVVKRLEMADAELVDLQELINEFNNEIARVLCVPSWVLYNMQYQMQEYQIMLKTFQTLWNHKLGVECDVIKDSDK